MRSSVLLAAAAFLALASAETYDYVYHGMEPDIDPLGKHCFDVLVDSTEQRAKEWLGGNAYKYTGTGPSSYNFTKGPCPTSIWPVLESDNKPSNLDSVHLRKWGHNTTAAALVDFVEGTCLHQEDTVNNKCYEACSGHSFKMKGVSAKGRCPGKYNEVDASKSENVCSDGVTNLKYCTGSGLRKVEVTIKTKGIKGAEAWSPMLLAKAAAGTTKDCRTDKSSTAINIVMTNGADAIVKIRGCQNQYSCKPYVDCDLTFAANAVETIVIDSSFKYFVFEYKGKFAGQETEMYPDANLHYPATYTIKAPESSMPMAVVPEVEMISEDVIVINSPSPGNHAHCTEITFIGGKDNAYYKAHGYQYTAPAWQTGPCGKQYNWFNRNETIAEDVVETILGVHQ
jgi:hypothetical protein